MSGLHEAIQALTGPTEMAPREGGRLPGPSLWSMILGGVTREGGSGGKPSSRPPVTSGVLSLVAEVERWCRVELAANGDTVSHTPRGERDVPDELERIAFYLVCDTEAHRERCERTILGWVNTARNLLGMVPQRIGLPRGTRCLACDAAWIDRVTDDGEMVRDPAVVLLWSDDKSAVDRAVCLACFHEVEACDLLDLATHQRRGKVVA